MREITKRNLSLVLLVSVFTCSCTFERMGDSAEDLLNELPGIISLLEADPTEIGLDRAQHVFLRGQEYLRTLGLFCRRMEVDIGHAQASQISK